jgi:hypothetical protein
MQRIKRKFGLGIFIGILVGCSTPPLIDKPRKVNSHHEVGSSHTAVISVMHWDDIKKDLQPAFKFTTKDAFDAALPVTQAQTDKILSAFSFGLGLSLGSRTSTASEKTTSSSKQDSTSSGTTTGTTSSTLEDTIKSGSTSSTADGVTTDGKQSSSTNNSTNQSASGSTTGATNGTSKTSSTEGSSSRDRISGTVADAKFATNKDIAALGIDKIVNPEAKLGSDVILRALAATSIFQELKLLDSYVENLATRNNYEPYMVRTQLTLMPKSANLGYDAYVNLSFFAEQEVTKKRTTLDHTTEGAVVVPLLVTDNLETSSNARAIETIRQLSVGLSGVINNIGLQTQFGNNNSRGQTVAGSQLNSVMTVGKLTDSTLRVRLGAVNQGSAGLLMVPRNYNVTLVVLVPKGTGRIGMVSKTSFLDSETGEEVPQKRVEKDELQQVVKKYESNFSRLNKPSDITDLIKQLDTLQFIGAQDQFVDKVAENICTVGGGDPYCPSVKSNEKNSQNYSALELHAARVARYLWADLAAMRSGSRFGHSVFDLPKAPEKKTAICPATQTALVIDNKKQIQVLLAGAKDVDEKKLTAWLVFPACSNLRFASTSLLVDGNNVSLNFPSVSKLKLDQKCLGSQPQAELEGCKSPDATQGKTTKYQAYYQLNAEPDPDVKPPKLTAFSQNVLRDIGGNGQLTVGIDKGSETDVLLSLKGGDVMSVNPSGILEERAKGWLIVGSGQVEISLKNLYGSKSIALTARAEKQKLLDELKYTIRDARFDESKETKRAKK